MEEFTPNVNGLYIRFLWRLLLKTTGVPRLVAAYLLEKKETIAA